MLFSVLGMLSVSTEEYDSEDGKGVFHGGVVYLKVREEAPYKP